MHGLSTRAKGFAITLAGVLILSPDALLIRLIETDNWTIIFYRGLFTASVLILFMAFRHGRDMGRILFGMDWLGYVAGFLYGLGNVLFVNSINMTLVANTLVILAATPLIAALLSRLLLKEHQSRETWLAIAIVLAGVGVIFSGSVGGGHFLGDLLAAGAATAMAANLTVLRRSRLQTPLPTVVLGGLVAAFLSGPMASPQSVSGSDLMYLAIVGGIVMPVSFGLIFLGPKFMPSSEVALIMLLEAITGPALVWLVLGEVPTPRVVLAGTLILGTVGVHALFSLSRERRYYRQLE
ncbi:MAG: DMT family transporter [Rhodospirillales bacterium]|nr:DMT family transporter [Rhodospirillales bacterium]